MSDNRLFHLSGEKYLTLLFLLFGVGFFSSGVVTWVAANWDYFSKFQKLYATQFWLSISLLLAVVFFLRESKRLGKQRFKPVSVIFFFITAVFVGALFALIGQIYQTGANAWELFALWSLLQIPLLLILPNIGSTLLLTATLNITLGLYGDTFNLYKLTPYLFAGLNLVIVILSEIFYKKLHDESWRIVPKIANLALAMSLFIVIFDNSHSWRTLSFLISIGCIVFYRKRLDLFPLVVHFTALIINFDTYLLGESYNVGTVVFTILATLSAFIFGVFQLKKLFFIRYPNLEMSSVVQVMFAILAIFITGLVLALIHLMGNDNEIGILIVSIILFVLALLFHYGKSQDYLVDLLMAVSVTLAFFYFMINQGRVSEDDVYQFGYAVIGMAIYLGLIYYFKSTFWLRALAVLLFIGFLLSYYKIHYWVLYGEKEIKIGLLQQFFGLAAEHWLMFGAVILFYLKGKYSVNSQGGEISKISINITPIAWAFIILAYATSSSLSFRWSMFGDAPELPSINSFLDLFNVLTANVFLNLKAERWLYHLLYFSVCILPLLMFFLINRDFSLREKNKWLVAIVLGLFSISFVGMNVILFCLALLLVAYINSSRILFAVATLFFIGNLSFYYYWLAVPLLYKSFLLLVFGLIFFVTSVLLYHSWKMKDGLYNVETNRPESSAVGNSLVLNPIFSLLTLAVILGIANYSIIKYEDVLNNGKPIIVKLAPVDPRSLMQGDYMALNYEILTQFRQQFYGEDSDGMRMNQSEEKQRISKVYALVKEGDKNVADLCRIELNPPTDFTGCKDSVYLPINTTNPWSPTLPSHSYFFAEGKAAYYANAEYGEYRFKDGKALLMRLLDKNLMPL